jgi:hypothetical protein
MTGLDSRMATFEDCHETHDAPRHVSDKLVSDFTFPLEILPPSSEPRSETDCECYTDECGEERMLEHFDQ